MQYSLPIFENLCPGWVKTVELGIRREFQKGCQIFDLESSMNGVYLVLEGQVEILLYTLQGPEKILFYVGPGCIFGEVGCFVSGDTGEARIRARTDCVTYFFSRELIENTISKNHPELLIELIRVAAYKIRMFSVLLKDSLIGDNFQRVCKNLIYLVKYKGIQITPEQKRVKFDPGISQQDLARLMGIHRVTLSKAIGQLKTMGIIHHFTKNRLEIINYQALVELTAE